LKDINRTSPPSKSCIQPSLLLQLSPLPTLFPTTKCRHSYLNRLLFSQVRPRWIHLLAAIHPFKIHPIPIPSRNTDLFCVVEKAETDSDSSKPKRKRNQSCVLLLAIIPTMPLSPLPSIRLASKGLLVYEGLLEVGITVLGRVGKRRGWGPRWSHHVLCSDDARKWGAVGRGQVLLVVRVLCL